MFKKVSLFFFLFILFITIFCFGNKSWAYNYRIFENYKKDFMKNWWFPINKDLKVEEMLNSAPYDSFFVYANPKDFQRLVNPNNRSKQKSIITTWFLINKKNKSDWSLRWDLRQKVFVPEIKFFTWKTTLRWQLSLECIKPSFKIKNSELDVSYKLKWFCGASYGVEEKMFGNLVEDMGSSLLNNYFVFFKQQNYKKLYINGKLYWLYLEVPAFNKDYLNDTKIVEPKKKKNCILKVSKYVLPDNKPKNTLTSRLEYNWKPTKKDINFVLETKYWKEDICYQKKKKLLDIINQKWDNFEELSKLVNTESVLMWWLILRHTKNHISYTHNYLLVENNNKFSAGFWDIEWFKWCRKQSINKYFKNWRYKYNLLFSKVLKWYIQNNPEKIEEFEKKIYDKICNYNEYLKFKNLNLKYVIADRFYRSIWHISPMFLENVLRWNIYKTDFLKIYKDKIDFRTYFQKQYKYFDKNFWF